MQLEDCVALVLGRTRPQGSMMNLQLMFGMTMTNLSMYLHFGLCIIIHMLKCNPCASIEIPPDEKIVEFKAANIKNTQSLKMFVPQLME